MKRKPVPADTPLVEYFAEFIAGQPLQKRHRYAAAIKHFSVLIGRPAILSDLAGDADIRLQEHLASRGRQYNTACSNRTFLRALWQHAADRGDVLMRPADERLSPVTPEDWHHKPYGHKGKPCSICGYPGRFTGLHRRAAEGNSKRRWLHRKKTADGNWIEQEVGAPFVRKLNRAPSGPTAETVKLIAQAATMQANGKTLPEIAAALSVKVPCISDWRVRHPALWEKAFCRAMEANVLLVREMAGTEAVLQDPAASISRARSAERWCKKNGVSLLPPADELTLSKFYETYYKPNCLAGNSAKTFERYDFVMRAWQLFTGDPPLSQTTVETLATFRDAVSRLPGRKRLGYASPNTVRNLLRHLQAVLDKAGMPGRRNRDAAGLLQIVPWIKPPRELINPPRAVSLDDLSAVYQATALMERPCVPGFKPPAWWRLLLVLTYNTGLRRRTLFSLRMEHINWQGSELMIPAKFFKTGRGQIVPLGPVVMQHLIETRTDRELVLPFPHSIGLLYPMLYELERLAGLPPARRFGLHAIRRATATVLWGDSPQAAQLMLGHGSMSITQQRYVAGASILRVAANQMPQPEAFTAR